MLTSQQDLMATDSTTTAASETTFRDLMARVSECYSNADDKIGEIKTRNLTLPAEDKEEAEKILEVTGHLSSAVAHLSLCLQQLNSQAADVMFSDPSRRVSERKKRNEDYESSNAGMEMQFDPKQWKKSKIIQQIKD